MAYNRRNYLKRVYAVNKITDKYVRDGLSMEEIYRRYIYPNFYISRTTFFSYMKIDCSEILEEIENNEK